MKANKKVTFNRTIIFAFNKEHRTQHSFKVEGKLTKKDCVDYLRTLTLSYIAHDVEEVIAFVPYNVLADYVELNEVEEQETSNNI